MISIARIKKRLYLTVASYFRFFANISIKKWQPRVIAVTGSVGKTTLLNLLELQLGKRAHYSHNANSAFGISFDILGMDGVRGSKLRWIFLFVAAPIKSIWFKHTEEFYVVEIDGERPKETEFLAKWLKPEVTLWVSLGRTHAIYFDGQVKSGLFSTVEEAIVHEFSFLPKNTSKLVIFNEEVPLINLAMKQIDGPLKIGLKESALSRYKVYADHSEFTVNGAAYRFEHPMPKEVYTQLAMLGELAKYLGEEVISDLSGYVQPPGRSNFYRGKNNTKLIDSTYNAHLISMESIIDLYKGIDAPDKWIVIGDIVEQGEAEADEHRKLGEILATADFDHYILVGRRAQKYTYPEMDSSKTVTFLSPKDALKYLQSTLKSGATVLFKGSQYLEGIVENLLENPDDVIKLPRQELAARKRRARWGL